MTLLTPTDSRYYIKPRAVSFVENDLGDVNRVYVSIASGTTIMVYVPEDNLIPYDDDKEYQKWVLTGYSTKLATSDAYYIYARLSRSDNRAIILFSTKKYKVDGSVEGEEGGGNASGNYYYIPVGNVTATDGATLRTLSFDSGKLSTPDNSYTKEQADAQFMSFEVADKRYLNALDDDEASGLIRFLKGLFFGESENPISSVITAENAEDSTLYTENALLSAAAFSKLFSIAKDDKGNYYIRTPYPLASDSTVSSLGVGEDEGGIGGTSALYQLVDVLADGDKVSGAEDGNVLMYDAATGKWYGKKVDLPDVDFSDISDKFVSIDGLIKSLQEKDVAHDESITAHGEAINALQGKDAAIEQSITSLQSKDTEHSNAIAALQTKDTAIEKSVTSLQGQLNTLVSGDASSAIESFNEVVAFLKDIEDTETLEGILAGKQNKIDADNKLDYSLLANTPSLADFMGSSAIGGTASSDNFSAVYWDGKQWQTRTLYKWALAANKPSYTTSEVTEGSNLYFTDSRAKDALKNTTDALSARIAVFEKMFQWGNGDGSHIKTPYAFASDSTVSSLGIGSDEGGGLSFDRLDSWDSYTDDKAGYVLSALLGWDLKTRLDNLDLGDFDLSGYLSKEEASGTYATIAALNSYATKTWVSDNYINKDTSSIYIDKFENNVFKGGLSLGSTRVAGVSPSEAEAWVLDNATGNATFNGILQVGAWSSSPLIALLSGNTPYVYLSKSLSAFTGAANIYEGNADTGFLRIGLSTDNIVTYDSSGKQTVKISTSTGEASFKSLKVNDVAIGSLAFKNSLAASDIPSLSWSKITSGKPTTLSGYGITDALKITIPDAEYPKEIEVNGYDNIYIKDALQVDRLNIGMGLTPSSDANNLLYDNKVLLSARNYDKYALPLTGGTITGALTVGGSARFNNDVWCDIDASADYLYARTDLTVGDNSLTDPNIYITKDSFKMYPLGQEISEGFSLTYELLPQANIYKYKLSNGVITLAFEDTYIDVDGPMDIQGVNTLGMSIYSNDFEHEITYLGNNGGSWIGTDLDVYGSLSVEDYISIGLENAKIWWDSTNQCLRTNVAFASDKTVSSLGVGTESGGGGTGGYASLDNVASDVLPSASNTFTIGNASRLWKALYANSLYLDTTNVGESISSLQSGLATANGNIGTLNTRVTNIESGYAKKATTLAGYGITDALKVTVPDAEYPREVELDYEDIYIKNALSVDSIFFRNGFPLSLDPNEPSNLYYDGAVILSDWNYSNYALPLTGGVIKGSNPYHQYILTLNTDNAYYTILRFQSQGTDKGALMWANDSSSSSFQGFGLQNNTTGDRLGLSDAGVPFYNANTLIHSGNIGSQSVNYATSAGDADTLDGAHNYSFVQALSDVSSDINSTLGFNTNRPFILRLGSANQAGYPTGNGDYGYGNIVQFGYPNADTAFQLYSAYSMDRLLYRRGTWKADGSGSLHSNAWKAIAFIDSNVASAKEVRTADDKALVQYNGVNTLYIGNGIYDTSQVDILGSKVVLRYGASATTGLILNSSGNVTIGSSDLAGSTDKLYVNGHSCVNGSLTVAGQINPAMVLSFQRNDANYIWASGGSSSYLLIGVAGVGTTNYSNASLRILTTGNVEISKSLTVSGASKVNSLNVNDKASITNVGGINGTSLAMAGGFIQLYKNDDSAADYFAVDNTGNTYIGGTLGVDGAATVKNITVGSNERIQSGGNNFYIGNASNAGWVGMQDICSQDALGDSKWSIRTDGRAAFGSTLKVAGATTLSSTLGVTGVATFNSKVIIGGAEIYWDADKKVLRTNVSFASDKTVSSLGVGTADGGGGALVDILQDWDNYDENTVMALGANLGYELNEQFESLGVAAYMGYSTTVVSGDNYQLVTGNAVYTHVTSRLSGYAKLTSNNNFTGTLTVHPSSGNTDNGYITVDNYGTLNGYGYGAKNWYIDCGGYAEFAEVTQLSDINLKNILGDTRLSLGTMANAPLVIFNWKNKLNKKHHVGTIAQYWDACLPEVVSVTHNDTLALAYGELGVAMGISLATHLTETNDEVNKLKKRVEELENENKRLQERVNSLVA